MEGIDDTSVLQRRAEGAIALEERTASPSSPLPSPRAVVGASPVPPPVLATVLDARPVVALGLQVSLASVPEAAGVVVVGHVSGALEAVRVAAERGLTVVVVLDDADGPGAAVAAVEAGARGVALTSEGVPELVRVVLGATRGRLTVAASTAERVRELRELRACFSARELEALRWYATGMPAKSVARRMDVGLETVKTYVKRLREKARAAGVPTETRLELEALARRLDLLDRGAP
ncbi:DNA-binding response regulator, NarL/FixJ family, contains REC and HTH domains [Quadrisphaera granulorum]|uniref:DNA-binding NarL/FixJ family response regulator n=1 Tax=Quadrisphaera granulorum TaxID=317664 RepID=A0A316ABP3_9ACTN|nr:LuxR C-terminal-related transcriptional regulator [Quadrisphaera granulorum]PWJ55135.1 DNA-binding NarL/FixJ family response regulator [Quadrisphaera granulorum]SZE95644.1 DNA-binding response regulator, NarL/FixJ family, contains REC and HTH domains [Quadrisphaera granulorum]